jgi:glutaredoxin
MTYKSAVRFLVLCALLVGATTGSQAGIYKWVDADGRVQFSDHPPMDGGAEQVELPEINTYQAISVEAVERIDTRPEEPRLGGSKKVLMYSASWCGVCARARRFFEAEGIPFRELDVEKNQTARREWKRLNAGGVPLILVGGKRMSGFSEKRFMDLYRN